MSDDRDRIYALIKADNDRHLAAHQAMLEQALFTPTPFYQALTIHPPSRWTKWRRRVWQYLTTCWLALCGVELVRPTEWD